MSLDITLPDYRAFFITGNRILQDLKTEITKYWPLINRLADRRFIDATLAEEGALFVLDRLEEDNCRRLQKFDGRSKMSTFVSVLTVRLLEDFSRKKFGRVRPPQWLKALGSSWVNLYELLCLQKFNVADAIQTMLSRGGGVVEKILEERAWIILERIIHCRGSQGYEIAVGDEVEKSGEFFGSDSHSDPEASMFAVEQQDFYDIIFSCKEYESAGLAGTAFIARLRQAVRLTADERLLLKLCYQDDFSVTRAGEMLGLNGNQVHGTLRRLLQRLRKEFDKAGISDDLREMIHGTQ